MRAFIISVNEAAWEAIEDKWVQPIVATVDGTTHLKEISKYIDEEQRVVHRNSQALNAFYLDDRFSKDKLVHKVLKSLPERIFIKVTIIEKAKDITTLKKDELTSLLQTFELNLEEAKHDKMGLTKNKAFSVQNVVPTVIQTVKNIDEFKKQLALLIKSMKRLSKKGTKLDDNGTKKNTIKCYTYKGFDLFQSECANTKKKEKSLAIT
ncbi:hypothetical protein Gotri_012784 [Gossypium trilobum]|uniref:Uncharacterized protein n=1 Tax=Gossypium trilobum TaxID=34281 RepID=A0A7J9DSH8_9ROSI|nr:hypothetical protein [Gossypium trilobum]